MTFRSLNRGLAPLVALALSLAVTAAADDDSVEIAGNVRDETGHPVAGVSVAPVEGGLGMQTDATGSFHLRLPPGRHSLRVTAPGRAPASVSVDAAIGTLPLEITVGPLRLTEGVVVRAIRAEALAPVTKTDLRREDIERADYGQEMPILLSQTPSMSQYSETGIGSGYSYFYLRGIQQTRVNMTLDGVPLNEAEDSTLYFVDFDGLAGSLDSIQVQRGVGTSSVGSASFAGSVNFESIALGDKPELRALLAAGSFGGYRTAVGGQTGRVGPGLALYGRVVFGGTDGFREHSGVDQHTAFFGARRQGERSSFRLFGFSGREKTQLAFLAVDPDTLRADLRTNPLSLLERDRFGQDFVQAQWTRVLTPSSTVAFQGYYNGAQGFYRLLDDPILGPLSQYNLDWRFVGGFLTFHHSRGGLGITGGVHANDFASHHSRDVVDGAHLYSNQGFKREASAFAKIQYDRAGLRLFGDAQVRHSSFRYEGDLDIGSVAWTFFNPKLGVRYALRPSLSLYASLGRTTREPTRSDLFTGEDNPSLVYDLRAVHPERVVDSEAGVEYSGHGLHVQADLYAMEFRNEIALTGELSEIGLPLRRNVDKSHRRGVELELRYEPLRTLRLTANANASANRIATWNQSFDVYEADGSLSGSELRTYHDVRPLLTPRFIGNLGADYTPTPGLTVGLAGRYVSKSQLDNTDDPALATPAFFDLGAHASMSLGRWVRKGEPRLRIQVNNALDGRRHWPSGYSYLYITRDEAGRETAQGTPYYYPLATRSVFVNLDVRF
jgi:iron complex outermembrane receptor protein